MAWYPKDKFIWDAWFVWEEQNLHAFYLQADRRECNHDPEARHNLASVGHAVRNDHGWQEIGTSFAKSASWDDVSIWTGCVVRAAEQKEFLLFYTARNSREALLDTPSERQRPQHIGLATTTDLHHWQRVPQSLAAPLLPNPGKRFGLDGVAWRDPYVVSFDHQYYMFICARLEQETECGLVTYVTSQDLLHWSREPQFIQCPMEFYQMEVPQVFWRRSGAGKRCYVIFCAQEKDCSAARRAKHLACETGTYYLKSDELPLDYEGIPAFTKSADLLMPNIYAGKLLKPECDAAPMFLGFVWADEAGAFVGGISDPVRVHFAEDGSILAAN
jgi:beta-fructofuranosidase